MSIVHLTIKDVFTNPLLLTRLSAFIIKVGGGMGDKAFIRRLVYSTTLTIMAKNNFACTCF